jgi:catechol-2,3-dioxygenase
MALSVKDVNVSAEFYTNVLNLEIIPQATRRRKMDFIRRWKELHLLSIFKDDIKTNKAIHLALSTSNFDEYVQKLTKMNIE